MAFGNIADKEVSATPRCKRLDLQMPLTKFEYDELYWCWRDLAQALERELLNAKSDLEITRSVLEGRDGLG